MNPKNLIVPGVALAALAAFFLMGDEAKAAEPAPGPGPGPGPKPPEPKPPEPPPIQKKTGVIDDSTNTPGKFAAKYGGDWKKWREIASANPGMIIVDKPYTIEATGQVVYTSGPPWNQILPYQGLLPWNMGQVVNIPPSW